MGRISGAYNGVIARQQAAGIGPTGHFPALEAFRGRAAACGIRAASMPFRFRTHKNLRKTHHRIRTNETFLSTIA
jgi:hypothetical protein